MKWRQLVPMVKSAKNKRKLPRVGSTGVTYGKLKVKYWDAYQAN